MGKRLFEPFRTLAQGPEGPAAFRALLLYRSVRAAVMTKKLRVTGMHGHARITSPALRDMAAARTYQGRCKTPPVQKNENLPTGPQVFFDGLEQRQANAVVCGLLIEVDKPH